MGLLLGRFGPEVAKTARIRTLSAAVAAACAIEHGLDVDCDCNLDIALISHAGPPAKPIRQPVILYAFEQPLTVSVRS